MNIMFMKQFAMANRNLNFDNNQINKTQFVPHQSPTCSLNGVIARFPLRHPIDHCTIIILK